MKIPLLILGVLISGSLFARTLETAHFKIIISCQQNSENKTACDKATYQGTNKATGSTITLMGKQKTENCTDGEKSCHSLGYEFNNGATSYFVYENGQLQVTDGAKVILEETGTWSN